MKALSVKQPWATLLVEGKKTIEVRSWATKHRGPLVICASASPKNVFWHDSVDDVMRLMHAGCIIGVVELVDVRLMTEEDDDASAGNYVDGAYAWVCSPLYFCRPDPIVGRLNLFDIQDEKLVKIANDESDWIFNYECPQGAVKFNERCAVLS
jgi:hypothetical protein